MTEDPLDDFWNLAHEHARLEGEGDGSLASWRSDHARFFGIAADAAPGPDVVLERFAVLYQS